MDKEINQLWMLLDDIDTLSDVIKPSTHEEFQAFYKKAMELAGQRFKHFYSDGQNIFLKRNPCGHLLQFLSEQEGAMTELLAKLEWIPKEQFDKMAEAGEFEVGPFKESFGDGYGDPYNPNRQLFGRLNDGRLVYAETMPHKIEG